MPYCTGRPPHGRGRPVDTGRNRADDEMDEQVMGTAPVFLLTAEDTRIVHQSRVAEAVLGPSGGKRLAEVMDAESAAALAALQGALRPGDAPVSRLVTFLGPNGECRRIAGLLDAVARPAGPPLLRFTACHDPRCGAWLEEMMLAEEVLRGFVQASSEAMWCIEFSEPVDLTLAEREIVRQVFENECHWRLCNAAMARLYDLPDGLDLNLQPVSLYFPKNAENEAFVRQIIASNYSVDEALSIDLRHDGSARYMENNVRCSIANGQLLRMWGTVRDVTDERRRRNRLAREAQAVRNILAAIPDAILVIDKSRTLVAVNPSFESLLGWGIDQFLGRDVQNFIDLENPLPNGRRWFGPGPQRWMAEVKVRSGPPLRCDARISPIGEEAPDHYVLSLRPVQDRDGGGGRRERTS